MLCREPLAIGEEEAEAAIKSVSELAQETSKAPAAGPAPEPTKAATDVVEESAVPPETAPLVVELEPQVAEGGDGVTVDAFEVDPRPYEGEEGGEFPLPSSAVVASGKDDAMASMTSSLPGPYQAVLKSLPPFSGPLTGSLDASGTSPWRCWRRRGRKSSSLTSPCSARRWSTPLAARSGKSRWSGGSLLLLKV